MNIQKLAAMAISVIAVISLTSCQESIEERAAREAKEYTEKYCPTPPQNDVITDSMTFDKATKTQTSYLRFTGLIDNPQFMSDHAKELQAHMLETIRSNAQLEAYKEAGFTFVYICRSEADPKVVLLTLKYGPKDYR